MANVDRACVTIGLAWLVVGMLLGFYMGASGNNKYLDVHVAILLGGFVVLTFYGVLYRLWPALTKSSFATVQFWSAALGSLLIPIGAGLAANHMGIAVAATGSALAIAGAALMLWIFWTRTAAAQ